jgi:uncharacterized tellurite resistance protein B-like protein
MKRKKTTNRCPLKMTEQDKNSIFYLLYAMVLIDNRVVKVEMDMFFAMIESFLKTVFYAETLTAKATITNWFMQNYKTVLTEMRRPNRETYLLEHVEALKAYGHKEHVFNMMKEIAIADGEYHDDERLLLEKISNIWNIDLSHSAT